MIIWQISAGMRIMWASKSLQAVAARLASSPEPAVFNLYFKNLDLGLRHTLIDLLGHWSWELANVLDIMDSDVEGLLGVWFVRSTANNFGACAVEPLLDKLSSDLERGLDLFVFSRRVGP